MLTPYLSTRSPMAGKKKPFPFPAKGKGGKGAPPFPPKK
jgi:hypothetical protein